MIGFATYHKIPKITEAVLEYADILPENRVLNLENSLKRGPPTEIKNDGLIKMKFRSQDSDDDNDTIPEDRND